MPFPALNRQPLTDNPTWQQQALVLLLPHTPVPQQQQQSGSVRQVSSYDTIATWLHWSMYVESVNVFCPK
jgi:hypothetical protein